MQLDTETYPFAPDDTLDAALSYISDDNINKDVCINIRNKIYSKHQLFIAKNTTTYYDNLYRFITINKKSLYSLPAINDSLVAISYPSDVANIITGYLSSYGDAIEFMYKLRDKFDIIDEDKLLSVCVGDAEIHNWIILEYNNKFIMIINIAFDSIDYNRVIFIKRTKHHSFTEYDVTNDSYITTTELLPIISIFKKCSHNTCNHISYWKIQKDYTRRIIILLIIVTVILITCVLVNELL